MPIREFNGGQQVDSSRTLECRRRCPQMEGKGTRVGRMLGTNLAHRTPRAPGQPCLARGDSKSKSKDAPPPPLKISFPREIASLSACLLPLSASPKPAQEGCKPAGSLGLFISSRQILCQCSLQLGDTLDNLTTPSDASRAFFSSFRKGWASNRSI